MFNFNKIKMSKFEKELLERLSEKNKEKIAEKAFNKATARVNAQIAALKYKRTELQDMLDEAIEALDNTTFCENFDLAKYDAAKEKVDGLENDISDIDNTIEARTKLLNGWA